MADTPALGAGGRKAVRVRIPLPAPTSRNPLRCIEVWMTSFLFAAKLPRHRNLSQACAFWLRRSRMARKRIRNVEILMIGPLKRNPANWGPCSHRPVRSP